MKLTPRTMAIFDLELLDLCFDFFNVRPFGIPTVRSVPIELLIIVTDDSAAFAV